MTNWLRVVRDEPLPRGESRHACGECGWEVIVRGKGPPAHGCIRCQAANFGAPVFELREEDRWLELVP